VRALSCAAALALTLVPSASAIESTIYPGVGIGKVKLGMTKAQVESSLGNDHIVNAREAAYTELAWDFGSWTVGFKGGRAVQIATTLIRQRTTAKIGAGATWRALMRAYPGGRCTWNGSFTGDGSPTAYWLEYLVAHRGGTQTLYVFHHDASGFGIKNLGTVVNEVVVRAAFRPLPEFQRDWKMLCDGDWRHGEKPRLRFVNG
jgi:hypothetical protein